MEASTLLEYFLKMDIDSIEAYESFENFVDNYDIRNGQFETNLYVVTKINRDCFALCQEHEMKDGRFETLDLFCVSKNDLLSKLKEHRTSLK